jgi:diaphanous 1
MSRRPPAYNDSVSLAEVTNAIASLQTSMRTTRSALTIPPVNSNDELQSILQPFIDTSTPQIIKLDKLYNDLQSELRVTMKYFGIDMADSKPEDLFNTTLSFSNNLQKAAAEMTKHALKPHPIRLSPRPSPNGIDTSSALLHAAARRGSQASSSSVENIKPDKERIDIVPATKRFGTMARGDLDEAIRSIHGGVRRRERREASTIGRGVRLSKIFLDGGGSVRGK